MSNQANKELEKSFSNILELFNKREEEIKLLKEENNNLKQKIIDYEYKMNQIKKENNENLTKLKETKTEEDNNYNNNNNNKKVNFGFQLRQNSLTNKLTIQSNENNNQIENNKNEKYLLTSPGSESINNSSRNDVKSFLSEVKEKISSKDFKEFIKYIKILTDRSNSVINRKEIFDKVKILFGNEYNDLYKKFELILSIKKWGKEKKLNIIFC